MKISITLDNGELIEMFTDPEIGDIEKPIAMANLMQDIKRAVKTARRREYLDNLTDNGDRS